MICQNLFSNFAAKLPGEFSWGLNNVDAAVGTEVTEKKPIRNNAIF